MCLARREADIHSAHHPPELDHGESDDDDDGHLKILIKIAQGGARQGALVLSRAEETAQGLGTSKRPLA